MVELASRVADVLSIFAMLGLVVFATSYGVFFRWWKTSAGRALMYFVLSLLALSGLTLIRLVFGEEIARLIRPLIMLLIVLAVWGLVWALLRRWKPPSQDSKVTTATIEVQTGVRTTETDDAPPTIKENTTS